MSIAQKVKAQIEKHYTYEGNVYINTSDLSAHLKNDMIDNNQKPEHGHNGFDESFDQSVCVFYYQDNSILVVACTGGMTASGN